MFEKLKARVTKAKKESSTRKGQRNGQGADHAISLEQGNTSSFTEKNKGKVRKEHKAETRRMSTPQC